MLQHYTHTTPGSPHDPRFEPNRAALALETIVALGELPLSEDQFVDEKRLRFLLRVKTPLPGVPFGDEATIRFLALDSVVWSQQMVLAIKSGAVLAGGVMILRNACGTCYRVPPFVRFSGKFPNSWLSRAALPTAGRYAILLSAKDL